MDYKIMQSFLAKHSDYEAASEAGGGMRLRSSTRSRA
ncbi:hypothetical protein ES703_97010 [subsurface metagenome]